MRDLRAGSASRWHLALVVDVVPAAVLFVAAELEVLSRGYGATTAAVAALATLPLLARRRLPVLSFVIVCMLAPTLDVVLRTGWNDDANASVFAVLSASYSVAAHAPRRRSLPAAAGALGWLLAVLVISRGHADGYGWLVFMTVTPWLSGRGVRVYRLQAERLRALTERLRLELGASERLAVVRERQRIALDIADAIGHAVGVMELHAAGAERVLGRDCERARRALEAVQETGRKAVGGLRDALQTLRSTDATCVPVAPPQPILAGVPRACSRWRRWSPWVDAAVAVVMLGLGVVYVLGDAVFADVRLQVALLQFPAALAIAVRQHYPVSALALGLAALVAESVLIGSDAQSPTPIVAVLLASYSAAVRAHRRHALVAYALALGVIMGIDVTVGPFDAADLVLDPTLVSVPWLAGWVVAEQRRRGEALRVVAGRLERERAARARLALLEERARVARELHDSVAHAVSVMVLQAGAAERALATAPEQALAAVCAIRVVGRRALGELERLLAVLRTEDDAADVGLAQLDGLVAQVRRAGLPVELRVRNAPTRLPAGMDVSAYRIVQESLTNALKHAGAVPTTVTVDYRGDALGVEVRDAGNGGQSPEGGAGHGLLGMRERVLAHGGTLHAAPHAGGGFAVRAQLPLDGRPA